ncbi:hypothetical protein HYX17_04010 [Candidatus Woesearchaeota archaeon]|nr:hypothetical protein [Candidatus Woesearchaeota archaeon]
MSSIGNFSRNVALTLALGYGVLTGCGVYSLPQSEVKSPTNIYSESSDPNRKRLETMANSKILSQKREGLKGLCGLVYNNKVSSGEAIQITNFVYEKFDENASNVTVYPVGKIWNVHTKELRTVGHRYPVPISWGHAKNVFDVDKQPVMEACSKMGEDYVKTTTPGQFDAHKSMIRIDQLSKLYGDRDVLKGVSWDQLLKNGNYKPADGGHNISIGFK